MSNRVTTADLRAVALRLLQERSYVPGPGVQSICGVDSRRLTIAEQLSKSAARTRRHDKEGRAHAELVGLPAKAGAVPDAELQEATRLALQARSLRETTTSFEKDRVDRRLKHGKHYGRKPACGPARPFASACNLSPSDFVVCPDCGDTFDEHSARAEDGKCFCGGKLAHEWSAPPMAERFALSHARAEGSQRAWRGSGSSVEYVEDRDRAGVLLGVHVRANVGVAGQLEIADWCPTGPRPTDDEASAHEDRQQDLASHGATLDWINRRCAARKQAEVRMSGAPTRRGRRGGKRSKR